MVKDVYAQILKHGEVIRGYLGVGIRDLWEGMSAALAVPDMKGALVDQVMPDAPAEKAGINHGDVIRKIDGIEIENSKMLQQIVSHKSPGDKIHVTLLRKGEQKEFTVELTKFPAEIAVVQAPEKKENVLGLTVEPLPEQLARPGEEGVLITDVEPNGPADEGELAEGDIILEVNMQEVKSVNDFWKLVDNLKPGQWVSFYIRRDNQTIYRAVKIPTGQQ
jgi:serine protease Do